MKSQPVLRTVLACVLGASLCPVFTGCTSPQSSSPTNTTNASSTVDKSDIRWMDFDDGNTFLSFEDSYVHSNAPTETLTLLAESGCTFAQDIAAQNISLAGALSGWTIANMERVNDTTLSLTIDQPEKGTAPGAVVGYVSFDLSCLNYEAPQSEASENSEQPDREYTADEINEMKHVYWPSEEEAIIVNADVDNDESSDPQAAENDQAALQENASEEQQGQELGTTDVAIKVVNPRINLDADNITLNGDALTLRLLSADFDFDGNLKKEDFSLKDGGSLQIKDIERKSNDELDVTLTSSNADGFDADLGNAVLVLAGNANESEEDIAFSLDTPDPSLQLELSRIDEKAGTVQVDLDLDNVTVEAIEKGDLTITLIPDESGELVAIDDFNISKSPTGSTITVPTQGSASGTIIVSTKSQSLTGIDSNPIASVSYATNDTRSNLATELLVPMGKSFLTELISSELKSGYHDYCTAVSDPSQDSISYERSNNDLFKAIKDLQAQVNDVSLGTTMLAGATAKWGDAVIISNANTTLSQIKARETILQASYNTMMEKKTTEERKKVIDDALARHGVMVDSLFTDMTTLHDLILTADPSTREGLVAVYDRLMAESYNWGSQTNVLRSNYREIILDNWVLGQSMLKIICGAGTHSEDYKAVLASLDSQAKDVDTAIKTREIPDSEYTRTLSADKSGSYGENNNTAIWCYTSNSWCVTYRGDDTPHKWNSPFWKYKPGKDDIAWCPFVKSTNGRLEDWSTLYVTTDEAKIMATKIVNGKTLREELQEAGLGKKDASQNPITDDTAKYLVTSCEYNHADKVFYSNNDWYFDSFELDKTVRNVNVASVPGFTKSKQFFDGSKRGFHHLINHKNWVVDAKEMLVLVRLSESDLTPLEQGDGHEQS